MSKIILTLLSCIVTFNVMAQEKIVQTAGRDQLGNFAPGNNYIANQSGNY